MNKKTMIKFNVIAIICIVIFCMALTPITFQNDTFYTIKIGEHIINNGIDMHDPFSIHDIPYTYPHWLYDVATYLIYNISGFTGLYITTMCLACILGITIYVTNKKIVKNELISFVLTLGVMCVLKDFIAARAQLVTFILFALTLYFIEAFLGSKKKKYLVGLIIIPIIIANIHLAVWPFYFVIFLPYIAEYLVILVLDSHFVIKTVINLKRYKIKILSKKINNKEKIEKLQNELELIEQKFERYKNGLEEKRKNPYKVKMERNDATKFLILVFIICLFTGLLTPLGDTPYTYLVKTMQGNTTKSINEHQPMVLINTKQALAIFAIVLGILIFTDTKIKLRDLFMIGGLTVLALMTKRQLSMLALLGVIGLNRLICDLVQKYDKRGTEQMIKYIVSGFGVPITILVVVLISALYYKDKAGDKFVKTSAYPVEASKYIKENLNLSQIRLYNEYNYGSYLLFEGIPVFIDSRADLYTPEFNNDENKDVFTDFLNVSGLNVDYEKIFKKYDITHLIIPSNAKMTIYINKDENYNKIYKDDDFVIYERLTD